MAFRQYTSCVQPQNYVDLGFTYLGWVGGVATIVTLVIATLASGFLTALFYAALVALPILISFLIWWLYGRLICLGGERCVIGVVMGRPSSMPQKKGGDDDASTNIALAPSPVDLTAADQNDRLPAAKEDYWANPLQGDIVKPNDAIFAIGRSYVGDEGHVRYLKAIHSEFEGSGIRNLLIWANVVFALLLAALIISLIPGGAIIAFILKLLAFLLSLLAGGIGFLDPLNPGDPADVNPNLGTLAGRDIVVVKGDWVYDSLHNGWNEIHAIHACQIIGRMEDGKTWPADIGGGLGLDTDEKVKEAIGSWCLAIQQAEDAEGGGSRDDPAQNWVVHPFIDGCNRVIIP